MYDMSTNCDIKTFASNLQLPKFIQTEMAT